MKIKGGDFQDIWEGIFRIYKSPNPCYIRLPAHPKVFKNYLNTKVVVKRACEKNF
jgi:hypothetical protein